MPGLDHGRGPWSACQRAGGTDVDERGVVHTARVVVDIVVPETELVHRLVSRFVCEDCGTNAEGVTTAASGTTRCVRCGGPLKQRSDDTESVVLERFKVYHRDTQPLVEYYKPRSTFRVVNGAQLPDRVAADLAEAVESASGNGAHSGAVR